MHDAADDAAVVRPLDAPYIRRQMRFDPYPLLVAQPKQVPAHNPDPLPTTNQDRIVRAKKLMSSDPSQAATLEFGGPTAEAVTFESGGGGTLYLDNATEFSGTVTGLAQADSIDLADFAFSSHPDITDVTGTGAAGSTTDVTIADGSLTTTLQLVNQYAGEYSITSTAYTLETDNPGSASAGTLFTTVANPPITAVATSVSGTEGAAISGATVATFTDANPNATASDFTATIDWGDGTSTTGTVVAQSGGGFAVDGAHTYADEGQYTIGVTVNDVGGSTASATSTATVADAPLSAVTAGGGGQPRTSVPVRPGPLLHATKFGLHGRRCRQPTNV